MVTKFTSIFILAYNILKFDCRRIFISYDRTQCNLDQSNCEGSVGLAFSNPIYAFQKGIDDELDKPSGLLEFFFEIGIHLILQTDLPRANNISMPLFEEYHGTIIFYYKKKS
jgi:hypothetical protein